MKNIDTASSWEMTYRNEKERYMAGPSIVFVCYICINYFLVILLSLSTC